MRRFNPLHRPKPVNESSASPADIGRAPAAPALPVSAVLASAAAKPAKPEPVDDSARLTARLKTDTHTKRQCPIWVVSLAERVSRGKFTKLCGIARKHDGYWSSFGPIEKHGFTFFAAAHATAFVQDIGAHCASAADPAVPEVRIPALDPRPAALEPSPAPTIPTLLEFAKAQLPPAIAALITDVAQVESYRAQYEKEYPPLPAPPSATPNRSVVSLPTAPPVAFEVRIPTPAPVPEWQRALTPQPL